MSRRSNPLPRALAALVILLIGVPGTLAFADSAATPSSAAEPSPAAAETASAGESVSAQATGAYRGKVTDRRGGDPVPGAVLVFTNEETGETFEATTDANGVYETRLPAGEYVVDIRVGKKTYRSSGTFKQEAEGKWVMDFTVGTKLTEKDLRIETTPSDVRVVPTEARPPLEGSKKRMELLIFLGGVLGIAAVAN